MKKTQGHHLILGELVDFITGETIIDTHDERYRQKLARMLVNNKGYFKKEIEPRYELLVVVENKKAIIKIDYIINLTGRIWMILKYGPGSLVTRHRPAIALSRLVTSYQVPFVVVTNGEDADIMEGATGKIISSGLNSLPSRDELVDRTGAAQFKLISPERFEMESRILYAFEVDGSCPCDDTICRF